MQTQSSLSPNQIKAAAPSYLTKLSSGVARVLCGVLVLTSTAGCDERKYVPTEPRLNSPVLEAYVQKVANAVAASEERKQRYNTEIYDVEYAQAFALPGDRLAVTRGLLVFGLNEAELACILGHEIAHHHLGHLKVITRERSVQRTGSPDQDQWSASQEREADLKGAQLCANAGYAPLTLVEVLRRASEQIASSAGREDLQVPATAAELMHRARLLYSSLTATELRNGKLQTREYRQQVGVLRVDPSTPQASGSQARKIFPSPFVPTRAQWERIDELEDLGQAMTRDWITERCNAYSAGRRRISTMPTNHYDAFGHCWHACEARRIYPLLPLAGTIREFRRQFDVEHDSFWEDNYNQRVGVFRSGREGSCYAICDAAYEERALDLSAPERLWVSCDDPNLSHTRRPGANARCEQCSLSHGDPHIVTADGLRYDFQAAGEFIAVESSDDDLLIQVRQEPWSTSRTVSVNTAVAARVHGDRVAIHVAADGLMVRVNGAPLATSGSWLELPGGGKLMLKPSEEAILRWKDGTQLRAQRFERYMNVQVKLSSGRTGRVSGLYGNFNGEADDDLQTRDKRAVHLAGVEPVTRKNLLYRIFGDSWRIRPEDSLFDYEGGRTSASYQISDFPVQEVHEHDLSSDQRDRARRICEDAGVRRSHLLKDCILDVAMTQNASFAQSAGIVERTGPATPPGGIEILDFGLRSPGAHEVARLSAKAGQRLFFRAQAEGEVTWSTWELALPDGRSVFKSCLNCMPMMQPGEVVMPETGWYRVVVTVKQGETGTAKLAYNVSPPEDRFTISLPMTITPDTPVKGAGRLETPGARDTYVFTVAANDVLALSTLTKDIERLYLGRWRLSDPKGAVVFDAALPHGSQTQRYPLKIAGTYVLTVEGGSKGTPAKFDYGYGDYSLSIRLGQ